MPLPRCAPHLRRRARWPSTPSASDAELQATRQQLEKKTAAHRRLSEQEAESRRKLEKARKRASQSRTGAKESKNEGDELTLLQGQLRLSQADQARLREELERLATAPSAADRIKEREVELAKAGEEIAALQGRVEQAGAAAKAAEAKLGEHAEESERLHKKLATQDKLYVSVRSELEAKKDRIRAQTEELERLRAFKVAVIDPVPEAVSTIATPEAIDPGEAEVDESPSH